MGWTLIAGVLGLLAGSALAYLTLARRMRSSLTTIHHARKRAQAAEHLAEIGSMTGGLAHEIKNPLSTIGLNAQLLAEGIEDLPIDEQDRSRLIRRIGALGRETDRLRGILEDFLEYAGELRLSIHTTSINTVIEELADFFSPMASGADTQLRIETDPNDPQIPIDADHIKQALLNLMLNAVHAMETNPPEKPRELIVRVVQAVNEQGESIVEIHVTDTGPGMDEETRSRIYHPYFTTKSGGTGLGLPTARRIIQAHHGQLELHSELGQGTDFVISLPMDQHESANHA
ncbi:MAG: two-component system sensor histidine kinase NtrB [Phycisphaerales bacterium]